MIIQEFSGSKVSSYDKAIYNELQVQAFAGTLTQLNTTLLDSYIAPCLKYYTLTEAMLPMTFKLMNKSVASRESDNACDRNCITRARWILR